MLPVYQSADAVDPSLFAVDANRLLSAMHQIQSSITEDDDITLRYLLRAYSQLAATVGPETFAPFVQNVLPYLVEGAERKAETLVGDDVDEAEDDWETVEIGGKRIAIRISSLEEKVEAVENLVLLVQALGTSLDVTTLEKMIAVAMPLLTVCPIPMLYIASKNGWTDVFVFESCSSTSILVYEKLARHWSLSLCKVCRSSLSTPVDTSTRS